MGKTPANSKSPAPTTRLTRSAINKQKKTQKRPKKAVFDFSEDESDTEVACQSTSMSKKNSLTTEDKTVERLTSQLSEVKKEAKQRLRESQKWEKMYKDEKSEREISDARLTKEEEKVKDLQSKLDGQMDSFFKKKVDASLKEERKKTTFYRNQMLDMAKRLELHSREALGGEPPAWKLCEICTFEYENVEGRIPRILGKLIISKTASK